MKSTGEKGQQAKGVWWEGEGEGRLQNYNADFGFCLQKLAHQQVSLFPTSAPPLQVPH